MRNIIRRLVSIIPMPFLLMGFDCVAQNIPVDTTNDSNTSQISKKAHIIHLNPQNGFHFHNSNYDVEGYLKQGFQYDNQFSKYVSQNKGRHGNVYMLYIDPTNLETTNYNVLLTLNLLKDTASKVKITIYFEVNPTANITDTANFIISYGQKTLKTVEYTFPYNSLPRFESINTETYNVNHYTNFYFAGYKKIFDNMAFFLFSIDIEITPK